MAGKTVEMKSAAAADEEARRERSTIGFPYGDLDNAIEVARALHANAGFSCETENLAGYMHQSVTSGAFRLNLSTARIFGLTENEKGRVALTELGKSIVDPMQERRARAEAFLSVPLYRAIFDKYKGHMLPPPAALEREMGTLGVSSKQTDKARQAFERSAAQAGYFEHGRDRLVPPGFQAGSPPETLRVDAARETLPKRGGGGGGGDDGLHGAIRGLLETLPSPGQDYSIEQRVVWLRTVAGIFDLIYKGNTAGATITVDVSNEQRQLS